MSAKHLHPKLDKFNSLQKADIKEEIRKQIAVRAGDVLKESGNLVALTLPSSDWLFEKRILTAKTRIVGVENNRRIYQLATLNNPDTRRCSLTRANINQKIATPSERTIFNFVWLDFCGTPSLDNICALPILIKNNYLHDYFMYFVTYWNFDGNLRGGRVICNKLYKKYNAFDTNTLIHNATFTPKFAATTKQFDIVDIFTATYWGGLTHRSPMIVKGFLGCRKHEGLKFVLDYKTTILRYD